MNDIHTIQPSVNGINEVGLYLKKEAEPPFAVYIQKELDELNAQWENVCKQVCSICTQRHFFSAFSFPFWLAFTSLLCAGLCKEVGPERRA